MTSINTKIFAFLVILASNSSVFAEWVKLGENSRMVMYADSAIRRLGDTATGWVLYDYKQMQVSQVSGKRYLTEKDQIEVNCMKEKKRAIYVYWYDGNMGEGVVVYTDNKPREWEPTSAPETVASLIASYFCKK